MTPTPESTLGGRIAIVTGGARGLGRAMARALADAGADVALVDRQDATATAWEVAEATGRTVIAESVDVTDAPAVAQCLGRVEDRLGVATVLVNSAGISSTVPALDVQPHEWRRVLDVNITGTFLPCQEFARRVILAEQPASIINVSSMSGFVVNVPQTQSAYNASKAAVAMATKSLAVEWLPHRIRVNAVAPGYFATDMTGDFVAAHPGMAAEWMARTPAGRMGSPEELGDLVVYLAGDGSRYLIGQTILIDGGYSLV